MGRSCRGRRTEPDRQENASASVSVQLTHEATRHLRELALHHRVTPGALLRLAVEALVDDPGASPRPGPPSLRQRVAWRTTVRLVPATKSALVQIAAARQVSVQTMIRSAVNAVAADSGVAPVFPLPGIARRVHVGLHRGPRDWSKP